MSKFKVGDRVIHNNEAPTFIAIVKVKRKRKHKTYGEMIQIYTEAGDYLDVWSCTVRLLTPLEQAMY